MSDTAITIVAKFLAQPGKAEELKKVLRSAIADSRAEEGNLHYDLYRSTEDGNLFLFHETWRSQRDIDLHIEQPHFKALMAAATPLLQHPPAIDFH